MISIRALWGRPHVRRLLRYSAVSVVATATSLSILGSLIWTRAVPPGWANLIATSIATVPSFELNRRWVWAKQGRRSLLAEVAPFWALALAGVALSTIAVSISARAVASAGVDNFARTAVAGGANISAFGALWVAQYIILDRILFRQPTLESAEAALAEDGVPV